MVRETKDASITIRFTEGDLATIHEIAEAEDVSAGTIVRRAVREFLERHRAKRPMKPRR